MTFDLDALQAAAEAATPGPWAWTSGLELNEAVLEATVGEGYVLSAYGLHTEGFVDVDEADAAFIAAANPAVVLELVAAHRAALARIARVEALHQPRLIQVVTGDCALGECEHEEVDECPTVPFKQCVACDELADAINTYYAEEQGRITAWPCPTVRALTEGEHAPVRVSDRGGAKSGVLDQPSNLVGACGFCNSFKESGADRYELEQRGVRVRGDSTHQKTAERARTTPVRYPDGRVFYLNDDGTREQIDPTPY